MKLFIVGVFISLQIFAFSQNKIITGYVSDNENGEKIVNATIVELTTKKFAITDEHGYYALMLPAIDTLKLTAFAFGYNPDTLIITTGKRLDIELKSKTNIDSVYVSANNKQPLTTSIGTINLQAKQIKLIPTIGAEPDIFKALQLLPGIQFGTEGKSDIYVRGGLPDENLIILDDVPLYYINHLGGFISVFNTDAINSVTVTKGGFPARYSSRLSSVIDVRMKDGNKNHFAGNFSVGITNTKFLLEGPILKNKSSYLISVRTFPLEYLMRPFLILGNEGQYFGYKFYDINLKINYKLNSNNRLFLSYYSGDDIFNYNLSKLFYKNQELKYMVTWGNLLSAFRWNHIFSNKFFVNSTLAFTRFRFNNNVISNNPETKDFFTYSFNSNIKDIIVKSVFDYFAGKHHKIKFGYNIVYHHFNPGMAYLKITEEDTLLNENQTETNNIYGWENIFFVENNISIANFFKANIGINYSNFLTDSQQFNSFQPRIVANFIVSENFSIKASYSTMQQYVHLLTANTVGIKPDMWVPVNSEMPPSEARQISIGTYFYVKNIDFSIIAYKKNANNLITYKEGAVFTGSAENWQQKIETHGYGESMGLEFLAQKNHGKITGWIAYTLAKSDRQFQNINNGQKFSFKYDRRHNFNIVANYKFKNNITFSTNWVFASGLPFVMPIYRYNILENNNLQNILIYADRNTYRIRAYHRLDVAVNFSKKIKHGTRTWTISIYNLYNRQNPYFYYTKQVAGKWKIYQQSLFPIIPSVSYSLKF